VAIKVGKRHLHQTCALVGGDPVFAPDVQLHVQHFAKCERRRAGKGRANPREAQPQTFQGHDGVEPHKSSCP
jgi:hypothetical protein